MTEREFTRLFPNASRATVEANRALCPAKPEQPARPLDKAVSGKETSIQRPVVKFVCCRRGTLDRDNLHSSIKDLLDGLRLAHLIVDDSEKHIELKVSQRKPLPGEEEHTLIEIYYA